MSHNDSTILEPIQKLHSLILFFQRVQGPSVLRTSQGAAEGDVGTVRLLFRGRTQRGEERGHRLQVLVHSQA